MELITKLDDEILNCEDAITALFKRYPATAPFDIVYNSLRVALSRAEAAEGENTALRNVLSGDEEQLKRVVGQNAALRDALVVEHQSGELREQELRKLLSVAEGQLCRAREEVVSKPDAVDHTLVGTLEREIARLKSQLCKTREAIQALLVMMARGGKPRKLDDALSWVQNDQMAQEMALDALSTPAPCRHEAEAKRLEKELTDQKALFEGIDQTKMELGWLGPPDPNPVTAEELAKVIHALLSEISSPRPVEIARAILSKYEVRRK